jgi:hypothetical protein
VTSCPQVTELKEKGEKRKAKEKEKEKEAIERKL